MKILQKQTLANGKEESMSSQADFLASLSPLQVRERERMITVTSGHTCSVQYGRSDPLGSLVRTLLESSQWFSPARRLKWEINPLFSEKMTEKEYCYDKSMSSKPSVRILNVKDIPSNRCLFRLVPSERLTEETESGLLPTVQTQGLKVCNKQGKTELMTLSLLPTPNASEGAKWTTKYNPNSQMGTGLTAMALNGLLPTPTAIDAGGGRINKSNSPNAKERPTIALAAKMGLLPTPMACEIRHAKRVKELKEAGGDTFHSRANGETRPNGLMDYMDFMDMLPTPRANKVNSANLNSPTLAQRNKGNLEESIAKAIQQKQPSKTGKTSQLNPLFVEEMMGFPLMYTTLPFLSRNGDRNRSKDTETP